MKAIIKLCFQSEAPALTFFFAALAMRLIGGYRKSEGRVEINLHGDWGTVCDNTGISVMQMWYANNWATAVVLQQHTLLHTLGRGLASYGLRM